MGQYPVPYQAGLVAPHIQTQIQLCTRDTGVLCVSCEVPVWLAKWTSCIFRSKRGKDNERVRPVSLPLLSRYKQPPRDRLAVIDIFASQIPIFYDRPVP